jgi:hypothetical protein
MRVSKIIFGKGSKNPSQHHLTHPNPWTQPLASVYMLIWILSVFKSDRLLDR